METINENNELHEQATKIARKNLNILPCSTGDCRIEDVQKMFFDLQVHQIELEMQNEELRRIHLELDDTKRRYYDLYNLSPVGYCTLSEEGAILQANLTAASMLKTTGKALLNKQISHFIVGEDQDIYYLFRKSFFESKEKSTCELRMTGDGISNFWAHLSATSVMGENNRPVMHLAITDISEHKRMQEELRSSDKMIIVQSRQAAMGEMISMIAHQWRQPLNIMGLAIANIETNQQFDTLDKATLDDNMTIINKNISFMSETIDDFRNFFKPEQPKEIVTMDGVLNSLTRIIGQSLKNNNIALSILNSSRRGVLLQKSSLIQVLLNIINNAKDAFGEQKPADAFISVTIHETNDSIVINICDNAGGINNLDIDKISQPYYTTKGAGGTGLGLHICKTIIEKHLWGTFSWHNKDNGACFVITIDLYDKLQKDERKKNSFRQPTLF